MDDQKLVEQYSGAGASGYDQRREQTPRFLAENAAFARLFGQAATDWVIDCPVGTGRWVEEYRRVAGSVIGIDRSEAMLREAEKKYRDAGLQAQLIHGSIFDPAVFRDNAKPGNGLVVSIRFMNWIGLAQVREALECLSSSRPSGMIIGASVLPREWSSSKKLRARLALARINLPSMLRRRPLPHVHDEAGVLAAFATTGWKVVAQERVFADAARVNYFYLLQPAGDRQ